MDSPHVSESSKTFGASVQEAIRFWEPHRITYNLILAAVVVAWLVLTWPHFRLSLTLQSLLALVVLAAMANVCYCAAYIVDVAIQRSSFRDVWQHRRWGLWLAGTLFAVLLENYWIADEIYPFVD
jgi:hypothetical protein